MRTWVKRLSFAFLAAGIAVWLSGCLNTSYFFMARYDDAKDEFSVMNVYQQIASPTPADSEYLYQLWLNRDHLIRVPNIDIFVMPAYVRLSSNQFAAINLGQAAPKLEPTETGVALDKIRVMPGTFFLRGPDNLCYYDQVVIPGSVVDQVLARIPQAMAPNVGKGIDDEIQRRKNGGKAGSWEKVREFAVKKIHAGLNPPPADAPAPAQEEEMPSPLDDESLDLLRRGLTDGSVKLTREKEMFKIVVPLSKADVQQVDRLWREGNDAFAAEAAKPNEKAPFPPVLAEKILKAFTLTTKPQAIELKIDLALLLKHLPLLSNLTEPSAKPAPEALPQLRAPIAALKAHGVPIDETITVEQLAKDFMANSLKSYPSEHPVKPGSGLSQKPAEEPKN